MRPNDFPIPAATDGQRVYANIFGVEMAFDLATGKMLWRTGRLHQLQFQQNRQGASPERYSISVAGGRTWSVTRDPQQVSQHPPVFQLVARDAATGKEVFNSKKSIATWNITGMPCIVQQPAASAAPAAPSVTASGPVGEPLDFSKGFATGQLKLNGKAKLDKTRLRLTDGSNGQVSSAFVTQPVSVAAFTTQFEIQFTKATADGMMFVVQGEGAKALGKGGDALGFERITKSVGVKFDLHGEDGNTTGLCLDGAIPTPPAQSSSTTRKSN